MKTSFLFFFLLPIIVFSQKDSLKTVRIKKGWNVGAVPAISFDSDLGFQYGGIVNLFHYGDGSRYPKYNHSIYLEISRFTKGNRINRFFYDSDKLIKGVRTTTDISFIESNTQLFYGFNGYESVLDAQLAEEYFYNYYRNFFRIRSDFQSKIKESDFGWLGGFAIYKFQTKSLNFDELNKGKDENDLITPNETLYEKYCNWGLIEEDEKDGGWVNYLKAGIAYDTRDNNANPMKGIWTELMILPAFSFLGNNYPHVKTAIIHRQYFTLIPRKLSFVYRAGLQNTFGRQPFYTQQLLLTSYLTASVSEGLGGSKSIRGIYRNRVRSDDFAFWNVETRWKFFKTVFLKQNFYLATNIFFDGGFIVDKIKYDTSNIPANEKVLYFSDTKEKPHLSTGIGLKIAMNENFIVSVDYGKAITKADGKSGIYIAMNYLF